jgi:tetrahydromethanopterin S-methyltransferase subunit A
MSEQSQDAPGSDERAETQPASQPEQPAIIGDVVFGDMASPVAVCTLGSRSLLPELAGRSEIAVAGRVFTENVGVERMIQNVVGMTSLRFLIVCGRETAHHVGRTILALHANGLDRDGRVVGSDAPEPVMPNLAPAQLATFQARVKVVDLIGETDPSVILARARALAAAAPERADVQSAAPAPPVLEAAPAVERIAATRDPQAAWEYDPVGYFVIFVDRANRRLRAEQYSQEHQLMCIIEGAAAAEIGQTIVRRGLVTLLQHAVYLGRELARAETALTLGLDYEQDRPLSGQASL